MDKQSPVQTHSGMPLSNAKNKPLVSAGPRCPRNHHAKWEQPNAKDYTPDPVHTTWEKAELQHHSTQVSGAGALQQLAGGDWPYRVAEGKPLGQRETSQPPGAVSSVDCRAVRAGPSREDSCVLCLCLKDTPSCKVSPVEDTPSISPELPPGAARMRCVPALPPSLLSRRPILQLNHAPLRVYSGPRSFPGVE